MGRFIEGRSRIVNHGHAERESPTAAEPRSLEATALIEIGPLTQIGPLTPIDLRGDLQDLFT